MKQILTILLTILITGCSMIIPEKHAPEKYFENQNEIDMATAIYKQDVDKITRLIKEEGYDVNTRGYIKHGDRIDYWTYLNYAIMKGKLKSAQTLLTLGADVNEPLIIFTDVYTNMNLACSEGNIDMVKLLLQYNINLNNNLSDSPFNDLIMYRHNDLAIFDLLLANGADINHPTYIGGTTPLTKAYHSYNYATKNNDTINYLLAHGADPLQVDSFGNSFASLLESNINRGRGKVTAQMFKDILITQYGVKYPVEVSYRKGIEGAIQRYENLTEAEKEFLGNEELQRINEDKESLKTGYSNGIAID